jgi:hypothetical protein
MIDIFPHLMCSDWVKVDIEDGEWTILAHEHLQWLGGEGVRFLNATLVTRRPQPQRGRGSCSRACRLCSHFGVWETSVRRRPPVRSQASLNRWRHPPMH